MPEKLLKNGISIRGDSLYCPLSFSIDSYWNCEIDCAHCYLRRLNAVWGQDLRPLDVSNFERTLRNGLNNKNPKTPMAWALRQKKTFRFGNKTDPFQPAEAVHRVSQAVLEILHEFDWSVVLQTKNTGFLREYEELLLSMGDNVILMPIISAGGEKDWEVFERRRTTPITERLECLRYFLGLGISVGVNGEPFIPGFHTVEDFQDTLRLVKSYGVRSYNTYNFHFTPFVAKRIFDLPGVDIERIWRMNQDVEWKKILPKLIDIAKAEDMVLGCPDFVNSGSYRERSNTCCGINVPNPCTFNAITWKRRILSGEDREFVFRDSWDGVGDFDLGEKVFRGNTNEFYTLVDAKL